MSTACWEVMLSITFKLHWDISRIQNVMLAWGWALFCNQPHCWCIHPHCGAIGAPLPPFQALHWDIKSSPNFLRWPQKWSHHFQGMLGSDKSDKRLSATPLSHKAVPVRIYRGLRTETSLNHCYKVPSGDFITLLELSYRLNKNSCGNCTIYQD